jgi:hypothetical protein
MSYNSKFISTTYLREQTPIQDNVDSDILTPYIKIAQDVHIAQALGSTFYNRLKEGVALNNLNSDEEYLLREFIMPCLAQFTYYEVLPHLNYKPTNKAISQQNSEWSTPSTLDDIKFLRNTVRDLAEFLLKRLNKHLCDYSNLFPEYENPDDKENLRRTRKSFFSGIYLPKSKGNDYGLPTYDEPYED